MAEKQINTVIFDVGMVLLEFYGTAYLDAFDFSEPVKKAVAKATVGSPTWAKFDKGILTEKEILAEFISNAPALEKEIRLFFDNMDGICRLYEDSVDWIKEVKSKGCRVFLLSNYPDKLFRVTKDKMEFLPYMDGAVFSYAEKCIKPEPDIYKCLLERYSIEPERAVFLDDVQANLDGARQFGIHPILVKDRKEAQRELDQLLEKEF